MLKGFMQLESPSGDVPNTAGRTNENRRCESFLWRMRLVCLQLMAHNLHLKDELKNSTRSVQFDHNKRGADKMKDDDIAGQTDKSTVLFVDDEPEILKAMCRMLRGEPYRLIFAAGGQEALDLLAKKNVQVIVADLNMPQMDGLSLLKQVQKDYPHVMRLVLTVRADSESILEAMKSGNIYRYILKPWGEKELKLTIRQALELFHLQQERRFLLEKLERQNQQLAERVEQRTKQVLALERKAYIGRYASQIVHNLNNPLQAIFGGLDLALFELSGADACPQHLRDYLQMAKSSAGDLGKIIAGILDHSRNPALSRNEAVSINEIIKRELDFFELNHLFKNHIEKRINLADKLPSISANPFQIKQIIDNLIKNAIDAMEESAVRSLGLETKSDAGTVTIKVADTGHGIPKDDRNKIFLPDFTTKLVGKGTGLGLASVKAMVEAYSGSISFESEIGNGTTFIVRIPIVNPTVTA